MNKQSLIFLGSKPIGYRCLEYLIEQQDQLDLQIVGLLTNDNPTFNPSLSLIKLANQYQIPIIESLDEMPQVDVLYSVQYHEILKPEHIAKANRIALNLHMAPLPEYRGCNQFSFAILDSKKEFGTTIHLMDQGIDHGDILAEKRFEIPSNCWVQDLYTLTESHSLNLFRESLADIMQGNMKVISQQSLVALRGTSIHYRKEMNEIKQIQLDWDEEKISRHIRATFMPGFEPPFTLIDGQKVYFTRTWK